MKRLELPQERLCVRRTGLPFYDAARVIGVAQLFFGTAGAEVEEKGYGWVLSGIADLTNPNEHRLWIGERLNALRPPKRAAHLHNRLFKEWLPKRLTEKWPLIVRYFEDPFAPHNLKPEGVYYEIESGLQAGVRGIDPRNYSEFASGSGPEVTCEPEPETLAALVGMAHSAGIKTEKKGLMFVLPVFGAHRSSCPITTARYWNYSRYFSHRAGPSVGATWAMLSMLAALYDEGLPVVDFAYNTAEPPTYHSGTLGAERMCLLWRDCADLLREIERFLQATSSPRDKGGHAADLARALADFALLPDAEGLERLVRLKARAMADDDYRARNLFSQTTVIEEIKVMLKGELPDPPESLCRAVRSAVNFTDKGWIGALIKLENATTPNRFVEEIERLISRAKAAAASDPKRPPVFYQLKEGDLSPTDLINTLGNPRDFRAFRAAFLLRVMQYTPKPSETEPAETPEATNTESAQEET